VKVPSGRSPAIPCHIPTLVPPRARLTVLVPALPEIVSEGDTEAEALAMAEDGIRLVLEDRAARREHVPGDSSTRIREAKVTIAA
jgi:antitoxin HicB